MEERVRRKVLRDFGARPPEENFEAEKERLFAKIGQIEMERDWLKKIMGLMDKEFLARPTHGVPQFGTFIFR